MAGIQLGLIGSFPTPVTSSYESIATITSSGSSITFSSIPSTYSSLQLKFNLRAANDGRDVYISLNSDTGTNYTRHNLRGTGTAASASGSANVAPAFNLGAFNLGGAYTTYPFVGIIDLHDYASTSKTKTVRTFSGLDMNTNGGEVGMYSVLWNSTSAITSVTITISSSSFDSSTFSLYGIKGA